MFDALVLHRIRVGSAKQVIGRAGTKDAVTILSRCKKCGYLPKDDFKSVNEEKCQKARTWCFCAYCGAPSEHETGTRVVTMLHRKEFASR